MSAHGITLTGYCARWASGLVVEPLGTWDSTGQEQLTIESASDEWQGTLTATFWGPSQETGTDMLMTDGACIVPPEALSAPGNGTITLRCTNSAGRRISVDLAYHSAGHAQVPGSPSEPTPDLWQQYVEQVQADADRAEQASKDAAGSADAAAKSAEAAAESAKQAAQATADIGEAKDDALEAIQQAQDTGVQAVQTATTTGVQAVQRAHQAALDDIATDRQQALTDIEAEGEKQTSAITSSGSAALEAIGQVEQTAIGQVQQAGQAQQTAIEQAGQSWRQQIAAAGTAELGRWAPAIWDTAPLAAEHDIYAAEGVPLRVTQQGETQQETTTGAQLFDADTAAMDTWLADGGVVVSASGFWTTDYIPVQGGHPYSYSSKGSSRGAFYDAQKVYVEAVTDGTTYDGHYTPPQDGYIRLSTNGENRTPKTFMLNAGSTALPWEPYTGGAPSPSPDYPQGIAGTGLNGKFTFSGAEDLYQNNVVGTIQEISFRTQNPDVTHSSPLFCDRYAYSLAPEKIGTFDALNGIVYFRFRLGTTEDQAREEITGASIYYHAASGSNYTVGISTEDDAGGYHGQALAIGSPLYGDSSVADMVANDVPSGCDKAIVLDGSETWTKAAKDDVDEYYAQLSVDAFPVTPYVEYSDRLRITSDVEADSCLLDTAGTAYIRTAAGEYATSTELAAALAANPLKIWYRSTAYTEAADLHIDKVTRRWRMHELDGTEAWNKLSEVDNGYQMPLTGGVDNLLCTHLIHNTTTADGSIYLNASGWLRVYGPWNTVSDLTAWLAAQKSAGTPVRVLYQLATPEEYASDPHTLPARGSLPETVKATGQSTVSYSADTKHYIDSKLQAIAAQQLNLMIGGST